jgi:hemolysin D
MAAHAVRDLLSRYAGVWMQAWRQRSQMDGVARHRDEAQFLPAALALQETPVHPAPRVIMGSIIAFAVIAVLWAVFGHIDIVAVAPGKVITSDRSKTIQSLEAASIKAILVRDGQRVEAGDALIELDATTTGADVSRLAHELMAAQLAAARATALLSALDGDRLATLVLDEPVQAVRLAREQRLLEGQHNEFNALMARFDAEISARQSELQSMNELVAKLEQTAPIAQEKAENYHNLLERQFISRHAWLEQQTQSIELEQDLAASRAKAAEIRATLLEAERNQASAIAETRRRYLDELNKAELQIAELSQEGVKAVRRDSLMRLTSPVDGVVQQLAVHTVGGVVTPAQALMVVVPQDYPVEIEAQLANRDVGFVDNGMPAEVKIETFQFTRYGTIPAAVTFVSRDAMADEKLGLVYQMRVRLSRSTMVVGNKRVNLAPGMAVTVEVKTGTRRVIEYFLNPFLQYRDESLRER